jgi:hypothetical protein
MHFNKTTKTLLLTTLLIFTLLVNVVKINRVERLETVRDKHGNVISAYVYNDVLLQVRVFSKVVKQK